MHSSRIKIGFAVAVLAVCPASAAAQKETAPARSSQAGVYTAEQAKRGSDTFEGMCVSCHATTQHASPAFVATWKGRSLWDLFSYLRDEMPKSDPGSLSEAEYVQLVAYLLKINGMPAGATELKPDSAVLRRIRFEAAAEK
jgi:mono/diheme cytochrome c family protein